MELAAVLVVLLAVAVPGGLTDVHLFCDCSASHHKDWNYALHCSRGQSGAAGVACQKAEVSDIPPGYTYIPGYGLIKLYRLFKPWEAAKKFCEAEGARLAVPPDKHAYDGLKQIFDKERGIWYAYIGITDQVSEGLYVGTDGHPVSYLPWMPNEPNNGGGAGENCIDVRNDGLINDENCGTLAPFICERRLSVPIPDSYTWLEDAGRFYKVHKEWKVLSEAAQICRSEKAALAIPDTSRRGVALLRLLEPEAQEYWIGFTDEAAEGDFVTETGRHMNDMEWQNWGVNEPNNNDHGRPENCLTLTGRGYFNDLHCDYERPFICEIAPL